MALFVIGDLHLSLGTDKPMDIFQGWDNYVEKLEENWKKIVKDTDTVVVAGDISWAMKLEECYNDFKFINDLPGNKIFLKGNHDYWWGTKKKIEEYLEEHNFNKIKILYNNAFAVDNFAVCGTRGWVLDSSDEKDLKIVNREAGRLNLSLTAGEKLGLEKIVFLHYPPVYGNDISKEIIEVLNKHNVKKCYYGHLHGTNAIKYAIQGMYNGIDYKLISSDSLNFMPYLVR